MNEPGRCILHDDQLFLIPRTVSAGGYIRVIPRLADNSCNPVNIRGILIFFQLRPLQILQPVCAASVK